MKDCLLTNRVCIAPAELREAYRLRYLSYVEKGFIASNEDELFFDKFDALPNSITFGLFAGNQMTGTMRASVFAPDWKWDEIPAKLKYPAEFAAWAANNAIVVEWGRFAIHPSWREFILKIELALLGGVPFLASLLPDPSFVCAVRDEHMKFYNRFGYERISDFAKDRQLAFSSALMAMRWKLHAERIQVHRTFSRCYEYQPKLSDLNPHERAQFEARFPTAKP